MLDTSSLTVLLLILAGLIIVCAFFSSSETGMMAINRYRLHHLAASGNKTAQLIQRLLLRPDRLLGVILIGNTFATVLASAIATVIAVRLWGEKGVALSAIILTLLILIFSEVTPKTLAALYPKQTSFFSAWPLALLLKLFYPIVLSANAIANTLLRLCFIPVHKKHGLDQLEIEELKTVVLESQAVLSPEYQKMMLSVLDLETVTVEEVMIPRSEISGLNLDDDWDDILDLLTTSYETHLPVYEKNIEHVVGVLHLQQALHLLADDDLTPQTLKQILSQPYFIPESVSLGSQLLNFKKQQQPLAFVVDEFGQLRGTVTLIDIIEEIVGEFIVDVDTLSDEVHPQGDGSYLVDGSITIRQLNKMMHWRLPKRGAKTLSGLIVEVLETMPKPGTSLKIDHYFIEIIQVKDNMVKTAKIVFNKGV